jgi:NAD(P)-dependent dehydrogenase (short-subunit alcohol dehydrogenase family)
MNGKAAVVTGGARGIGAAIARRLQSAGARVVVWDLVQPDAPVEFAQVDVRSGAEVTVAAAALDQVDVVVTSAGVYARGGLLETAPADLDRIIDVNLKGTYLVSQHLMPRLLAAQGVLLHVASGLALVPEPESPAYCASKAGVVMLTKCLAQTYAARGVRVNAILPGPIDTPMLRASVASPVELAAYAALNPMRRIGTVDDVANVAMFLVSDQARYVTGSLYAVDGGESSSSLYSLPA